MKKIINTRRGSLKKEFRKKEYEPCNALNKKRNSTGSALGDTKHAHKISNNSNRKVSSSIRADSTEDHKLSLGVRIKNNIEVLRESILRYTKVFW